MLDIRISPDSAREQVRASEALQRLVSGDALDVAMYGASLLGMVVRDAERAGAHELELYVEGAGSVHDEMAAANGFSLHRDLLRMVRDLPVGEPWALDVRPFRVGQDEAAWLEVNNRAFAWHPDQAGKTLADVQALEAEDWFDPEGFLLHERDGRLAGFCWTKIHHDERPKLGEIFVIGVDPDFHGQGLGRPLVLAGLDWLAGQGLRDGLLYTEADNVAALRVYEKLGFDISARNRWYRRAVGGGEA